MLLRSISFAMLAVIGVVRAAPAMAGDPLRPASGWNVDYGETQCLARRPYGDPAYPSIFGIRPALNGESYELLLTHPYFAPKLAEEIRGAVDFGAGPIAGWELTYKSRETGAGIYRFRISKTDMQQALSARSVVLEAKGKKPIVLALSAMPALLKQIDDCRADLQAYWNEKNEAEVIATPTKGDLRPLFSDEDYPQEAFSRNQEGKVQFVLMINEAGKVAGCDVLEPSGVPALEVMGCQVIIRRALFSPARDRQGKPVRSTVVSPPIRWAMEGSAPPQNTR